MTTRHWGAPSKWGIPIASPPNDTEPQEHEKSITNPNVEPKQNHQFTHPPHAPTTPEPKVYAYISGIGIVEGYVPPLLPLPVIVHEYVEPNVTAITQLTIWNAFPLINFLPVNETSITCWTQEELTMLSKFSDHTINVYCSQPDDFHRLGILQGLAESRGDINISRSFQYEITLSKGFTPAHFLRSNFIDIKSQEMAKTIMYLLERLERRLRLPWTMKCSMKHTTHYDKNDNILYTHTHWFLQIHERKFPGDNYGIDSDDDDDIIAL